MLVTRPKNPPPFATARGVNYLAYFALALGLMVVGLALYHRQNLSIEPKQIVLPADGAEHEAFRIRLPTWSGAVAPDASPTLRLLPSGPRILDGLLQTPVTPGRLLLHLRWQGRTISIPATFIFAADDSYADGTPDFLRLHTAQDRRAFRAWFAAIAESEAAQQAGKLPAEIDDCAALLRFAYREALRTHDENWLNQNWLNEHPTAIPPLSIRQYTYPNTPLGANLFRVRPGPFLPQDLTDGSFAQFADARILMEHNTHLVGRDLRQARPGDLIFYRQLDPDSPYDDSGYHSPFHSMILCGAQAGWVVYHTGPIYHGKGEIRRLPIADLLHHPDARWRPVNENANFLGVYRWNILRQGD